MGIELHIQRIFLGAVGILCVANLDDELARPVALPVLAGNRYLVQCRRSMSILAWS
jgi:hypothetical protein